jgi:ribonuclease Z
VKQTNAAPTFLARLGAPCCAPIWTGKTSIIVQDREGIMKSEYEGNGCGLRTAGPTRRSILNGLVITAAVPFLSRAAGVTSIAAAQAAPPISVTLLGTGTPQPRPDRFGPSILVEAGGKRLVFDAGRGLTIRLFQLGIPLGTIESLFITHFHSDHLNGLPDYFLTSYLRTPYAVRNKEMRLAGPTGIKRISEAMRDMYADDINIRMADEKVPEAATKIITHEFAEDGVVFDEGGVKVTAFKVLHGELIKPSFGYRVDHAGKSVVMSGDTKFDENLIKHSMNVDLLLHEVCMLPAALNGVPAFQNIMNHHTSPEECGTVFTRTKAKVAAYTHIVQPGSKENPPVSEQMIVEATRKTYAGPLIVGEDLMRFVIADDVKMTKWDPQRRGYPT